jgi:Cu(I)/Ag(I) efflux system membrane fusion protein
VEGEVFEQDLSSVRLGQRAVAELEAAPGQEFLGRITYIYPTVSPETRTARVRVELANSQLRIKPGMYATLRITGVASVGALSVPRAAVLSTGERNLVFVKRGDGMLEPRLVEIGVATDDRIQILRGVAAGDTVVASATFLVDAESNLGTTLGGMGNMPGMDMTAPTKGEPPPRTAPPPRDTSGAAPNGGGDHAGHEE